MNEFWIAVVKFQPRQGNPDIWRYVETPGSGLHATYFCFSMHSLAETQLYRSLSRMNPQKRNGRNRAPKLIMKGVHFFFLVNKSLRRRTT